MKKIVSIQEIIQINNWLKERNYPVKLHLRDACGAQSMWLESLNSAEQDLIEKAAKALEEYFTAQGFSIFFSEDKKNLWIAP